MVECNEPLVTPEMIMNQPKGQAYAFLNAQRLVKLRFPLLDDSDGYEVAGAEQVYKEIAEKYFISDELTDFNKVA